MREARLKNMANTLFLPLMSPRTGRELLAGLVIGGLLAASLLFCPAAPACGEESKVDARGNVAIKVDQVG